MDRAFPAGHIAVELVWQGEFLPETGLRAGHGGPSYAPIPLGRFDLKPAGERQRGQLGLM